MDSRFGFRFSSSDVSSGSSLTVGEWLCAVFFPFVAIAEAVFFALTDCLADLCPSSSSSTSRHVGVGCTSLDLRHLARLADESPCFSVSEVEALFELYKKISCSIIDDGLIHKKRKSEVRVARLHTSVVGELAPRGYPLGCRIDLAAPRRWLWLQLAYGKAKLGIGAVKIDEDEIVVWSEKPQKPQVSPAIYGNHLEYKT